MCTHIKAVRVNLLCVKKICVYVSTNVRVKYRLVDDVNSGGCPQLADIARVNLAPLFLRGGFANVYSNL